MDLRLRVQSRDGACSWMQFSDMDRAAAVRNARQQGLRVLEVREAQTVAHARSEQTKTKAMEQGEAQRSSSLIERSTKFDLLLFSQELYSLLLAGLNLGEALDTLLEKSHGVTRALLEGIVLCLREGRNFSDVLDMHAVHFPPVYVATVRSSERTGNLAEAIGRYITYQQQFELLRKKVVSAAIYPALLLSVGACVTLFLLGFVVPRFATVYESSGRDMPWTSSMLLSLGRLIHEHAVLAFCTGLVLAVAVFWQLRKPSTRQRLLDTLFRLPGLGDKADLFRLSRFYRALSLLLASGIALPRAMGMVGGLLSRDQCVRLVCAKEQVEQGYGISETLVQHRLATAVARSLIQVGERSGQLATMLERTASFHDEELTRWIDAVSKLLEPFMMLVIGLIIGLVVVLMYLPIFELAGSLN